MHKIITIFQIPELRKKIYFTALVLMIYRIGYYIPLPMINQVEMAKRMAERNPARSARSWDSFRCFPAVI